MRQKSKNKASKNKYVPVFVTLALAAYVLKNIFVGADVDEGYGIVVGYRLATGDRLLLDMWEPHQTSAIFTALFIRPFLWMTGGRPDFLNLYLRAVYFAVHGTITYVIYRTLRSCVANMKKGEAACMAMVFFTCSPKSIYVPEYSNLHTWFFAFLCLCFLWYYCETSPLRRKPWVVILAGFFLTCDVLSYPSMVLLLPFCLFFIFRKSGEKKGRDCGLFLLPCVVLAALFLGYVLSYMRPEQLLDSMGHILRDGSHQVSFLSKLNSSLKDFAFMSATLLVSVLLALGVTGIYTWIKRKKGRAAWAAGCFLTSFLAVHILIMLYVWFTSEFNAAYPRLIYIGIAMIGIWCYIKCKNKDRTGLYLIGLSAVNYVAVLLFSNWDPKLLTPYFVMGAIGGFLCWKSYLDQGELLQEFPQKKKILSVCCGLLALSCLFGHTFRIIGGEMVPSTLLEVRGYNHGGFRKWILTNYMNAYRYNKNLEIWPEAVPDGSKVLYVGPSQFFYMLGDCVISAPNTISTPVYDESLLAYWEEHPERYPDVVVFESWFGEIRVVKEDDFIMQWVQNEFSASEVIEYPYITVYKR